MFLEHLYVCLKYHNSVTKTIATTITILVPLCSAINSVFEAPHTDLGSLAQVPYSISTAVCNHETIAAIFL